MRQLNRLANLRESRGRFRTGVYDPGRRDVANVEHACVECASHEAIVAMVFAGTQQPTLHKSLDSYHNPLYYFSQPTLLMPFWHHRLWLAVVLMPYWQAQQNR